MLDDPSVPAILRSAWRVCGALLLLAMGGCGDSGAPSARSAEPPPVAAAQDSASDESPLTEGSANRLIHETSPYLRKHAHNPVQWFPWGEEALEKARRENKIVFLSVGYSSCHWCHVMERESFSDPEIAAYMNEHFVSIKVDREERPDVDAIYMTALQIYNQASGGGRSGGWPMSMFLLPDTRPFFGGTYFPARDGDRGAQMGFLTLIQRVQELWVSQRDNLRRDAATLTRLVNSEMDGRRPAPLEALDENVLTSTLEGLAARFDPEYGGFGYDALNPGRPKFPEPANLLFLIDHLRREGVPAAQRGRARRMLEETLERMAMGGIRDHVAGGFHRYSVDRFWRIPHFEKMLYDNAQLATVYSEAYALTGREDFRRVVHELLEFVRREMTAPGGAFYSALDAESEEEEGKFYRWPRAEVEQLLGPDEFRLLAEVYQLDDPPNFEGAYHVLQLDTPVQELAAARGVTPADLESQLAPLRAKLLTARQQRPRPLTDTKILTSWNGLMIRGFADAGRLLERPDDTAAAVSAAEFVLGELRGDDGRLRRTFSAGEPRLNAYLDDYAFLVDGLIALYRATGDGRWLDEADQLTRKQIELFWDEEQGGFFFTSDDHESLIARGRDPLDGAEPSGNSVSAGNLLFLARALERAEYREKAERTLRSTAGLLQVAPSAAPRMAMALAAWLEQSSQ